MDPVAAAASTQRKSWADDDMSDDDDDAPLSEVAARAPAVATQVIVAPKPESAPQAVGALVISAPAPPRADTVQATRCRASLAARLALPEPVGTCGGGLSHIVSEVSRCEADIAELQKTKQRQIDEEDYIAAFQTKQLLEERNRNLDMLRGQMDAMPTPSRSGSSGSGSGARSASIPKGSKVNANHNIMPSFLRRIITGVQEGVGAGSPWRARKAEASPLADDAKRRRLEGASREASDVMPERNKQLATTPQAEREPCEAPSQLLEAPEVSADCELKQRKVAAAPQGCRKQPRAESALGEACALPSGRRSTPEATEEEDEEEMKKDDQGSQGSRDSLAEAPGKADADVSDEEMKEANEGSRCSEDSQAEALGKEDAEASDEEIKEADEGSQGGEDAVAEVPGKADAEASDEETKEADEGSPGGGDSVPEALGKEDVEVGRELKAEASKWQSAEERLGLVELPGIVTAARQRPFAIPQDTFDSLYAYQREGVAWMAGLFSRGQGGVLADEMGLGKTVQVCAFLNGARKAGATHALLLLPVSLLDQWAKEARKWCPGWPVYIYYGSPAERVNALRRASRPQGGLLITTYNLIGNTEDLHKVIVDDAPSPRRKGKGGKGRGRGAKQLGKKRKHDDDEGFDIPNDEEEPPPVELLPEGELARSGDVRAWDVVICDEAHKMKNISTLLGKSLRQVRSSCRLLLTGTPVQNALQDLWAVLDFAQPGLLGNHATFVKTFSEPIDRGSVRGADAWSVQLKKHLAEQLRTLIAPHILRRTKAMAGLVAGQGEDVAEEGEDELADMATESPEVDKDEKSKLLIPKKETVIWLAPSEEQVSTYKGILEKSEVIREACEKQKLGVEVFRAIGLLKKLCNHPALLARTPTPSDWADFLSDASQGAPAASAAKGGLPPEPGAEAEDDSEGLASGIADADDDGTGNNLDSAASSGEIAEALVSGLPRDASAVLSQSAKLRCLRALLPALASRGHRTLVFSQSLKMLDLIQMCCLRPMGLRCLRLDGKTDAQARADKVAKFNVQPDRFQCMLMTTHVGGVGLNLTSADRVVIVDPAWNPATDAQAVDRAFRIGQTREVRVYRLIMSGLIEDKMFRLQVFKMGLTKTALEATQQQNYFTSKEIRALFDWTDPAQGETRMLLRSKHGEGGEGAARDAADEDGGSSDGGWLAAGPAVGLSDFTLLYGAVMQAEEPDDECSAQVAEAKQKLSAADSKLETAVTSRRSAEEHRDTVTKELEEAKIAFEQVKERRASFEAALKDRRAELTQARRIEVGAQQRLEKAKKWQLGAQEGHTRSQQAHTGLVGALDEAARAARQVAASAQSSEDSLLQAVVDAEAETAAVDDSGAAVGNGVVDASVMKLKAVQRRLEKVRLAIATRGERQAELELMDEEVLKADKALAEASAASEAFGDDDADAVARRAAEAEQKNKEAERQRAEQARERALQKVDAAREAVMQAAQSVVEGAQGFVDSFEKTKARAVRADQVKTAQSNAKAVFKQLLPACTAAKKAREACTKAFIARRKAAQKASAACGEVKAAERYLQEQDVEVTSATQEDEAFRRQRTECEQRLAEAEAAKSAAEAEEVETKRRREELKKALPAAREALVATKAAEKEAIVERQALHSACSKVERAQLEMEEAKQSAIRTLRSEEYDATQVEQAYAQKRKAGE